MERRRVPDEIIRKVGTPEIFKVDCTKLPPQALFSGQRFALLKVRQQLRPAFWKAVFADNIFEKNKLFLRSISEARSLASLTPF